MLPEQSELGKRTAYQSHYNPDLLFPIPRKLNREKINISEKLPFVGFDLWNHYEVSWLNDKGKPIVGFAEIRIDCNSPNIIESKSMKLYFNSFNNTKIKNRETLQNIIQNDLEKQIGSAIHLKIDSIDNKKQEILSPGFDGFCIDTLDIDCFEYTLNPNLLFTEETKISETLHSNLLKANCLVTQQPDWGSVQIQYQGKKINHEGLLRYLVSYRNGNDFSEQCIERIFMDIMQHCKPEALFIYGRFTRRGGIDINPYRSTKSVNPEPMNSRLCRQ